MFHQITDIQQMFRSLWIVRWPKSCHLLDYTLKSTSTCIYTAQNRPFKVSVRFKKKCWFELLKNIDNSSLLTADLVLTFDNTIWCIALIFYYDYKCLNHTKISVGCFQLHDMGQTNKTSLVNSFKSILLNFNPHLLSLFKGPLSF